MSRIGDAKSLAVALALIGFSALSNIARPVVAQTSPNLDGLPHWAEPLVTSERVGAGVLEALAESETVRVVVVFTLPEGWRLSETVRLGGREHQEAIRTVADDLLGLLPDTDFELIHRFGAIRAFSGRITLHGLHLLHQDARVELIRLVRSGRGYLGEAVPLVNADDLQSTYGLTGSGITVAVIDSGYDSDHPDLADNLAGEQCFCRAYNDEFPPAIVPCCPNGEAEQSGPGSAEDDNWHGTFVSGVITSGGIDAPIGMAPDTQIVAIKVLDSNNGFCCDDEVEKALSWIILNRPDVDIVNLSLGYFDPHPDPCDSAYPDWAAAIDTLRDNGILTFVSTGNEGYKSMILPPACIAGSIAVGAVYDDDVGTQTYPACTDSTTAADQVTCFSNSNSMVDLFAPGAMMTSSLIDGGAAISWGTSFASPTAAGCAALLKQGMPDLSADELETVLESSTTVVTDSGNGLSFPRVDCLEAWIALIAGRPLLAVSKIGSGSGRVTSDLPGIDCGSDCEERYGLDEVVTLTVIADPGSAFGGWSGDPDCSDGVITMDSDKACVAAFEQSASELPNDQDTLLLLHFNGDLQGADGETPLGSSGTSFQPGLIDGAVHIARPGGFVRYAETDNLNALEGTVEFWLKPDWDGDQDTITRVFFGAGLSFNNGMLVSIDGANNLRFIQWGDDPDTPEVESNVERGVHFSGSDLAAGQWYHLAVTWGAGTEMNLYRDGQLVHSLDEAVIVADFFGTHLEIGAFTDDSSSAEGALEELRISSRIRTASEISADYHAGLGMRQLEVTRIGSGSGRVTSNPPGIDCGADCSESYGLGTVVTLTATPDPGSFFSFWTGDPDCVDGQVRMDAHKSCTAAFDIIPFVLTVEKGGSGAGTVTSDPPGIHCGSHCEEPFFPGTVVALTATPEPGSAFIGWSGDPDCGDGEVAMTEDLVCSARFDIRSALYCFSFDNYCDGIEMTSVLADKSVVAIWRNWDCAGAQAPMLGGYSGKNVSPRLSWLAADPDADLTAWSFNLDVDARRLDLWAHDTNFTLTLVQNDEPYSVLPGACSFGPEKQGLPASAGAGE